MSILRNILGPKSKYEKDLPYGYEARVKYLDGEEDYCAYFADTICALVGYLKEKRIAVEDVSIFEIYPAFERELDKALFATPKHQWRLDGQLCKSFEPYYKGHIFDGGCTFSDRDSSCIGP